MREALKSLIEAGWLEEQPTSAEEMQGLLGIVERRLDELAGSLKYPTRSSPWATMQCGVAPP
jgi:hypothetical protein